MTASVQKPDVPEASPGGPLLLGYRLLTALLGILLAVRRDVT
jgi:hypothetical protein